MFLFWVIIQLFLSQTKTFLILTRIVHVIDAIKSDAKLRILLFKLVLNVLNHHVDQLTSQLYQMTKQTVQLKTTTTWKEDVIMISLI